MRRGINVKYTHEAEELIAALKATRELRHLCIDDHRERVLGYGRDVSDLVVVDGHYQYLMTRYYAPDQAVSSLGLAHGFSCVVCGDVVEARASECGHWREVFSRLAEFFSTGANQEGSFRDKPFPLCMPCQDSFFRKARRLGLEEWSARRCPDHLDWQTDGRSAFFAMQALEFEMFCLEWMLSIFEKTRKLALKL